MTPPGAANTRRRRVLGFGKRWLPLVSIYGVALALGILGIRYGRHWDEWSPLAHTKDMFARGRLLPADYVYPSLMYELVGLASLPDVLQAGRHFKPQLDVVFESNATLIRTRVVFLCVSSLGIFWTYGLSRALGAKHWQALLASALLAASWEWGYHARFIASDALMAQFGALSLMCVVFAVTRASRRWLWAGAVAAGLATATKYPAGVLLVSCLLAAWLTARQRFSVSRTLFSTVVAYTIGYLVSTPGTLLEPKRFHDNVRQEMIHYATGHPGGHTIDGGSQHLLAIAEYIGFASLSPLSAVSLGLAALALVGALSLLTRRFGLGLILLLPPLLLYAYMSQHRVMIVRNLLLGLPVLAVCSARGAASIAERWRYTRYAVALLVSAALLTNGVLELRAALGIHRAAPLRHGFLALARQNPQARYAVSPMVERILQLPSRPNEPRGELPANVHPLLHLKPAAREASPEPLPAGELLVLTSDELLRAPNLSAARHDLLVEYVGPRPVNLNYYPSWAGNTSIVVLTQRRAAQLGILDSVPAR